VELLTVVAVIGVVSAVSVPTCRSYYERSCIMAAMEEIIGMIREAKQRGLCDDRDYGVGFDPVNTKVLLIAGKGADDKWNTADDQVFRTLRLADKGGGLKFSSGGYGPVESGLAEPVDGVSFLNNNTIICNERLTGTAGAAYLISGGGVAMAITMNSTDEGYKLFKWNGKKWVRL